MKNNTGFTLIELLAVIVVLAIVMVLATTTVLPYMSTAREDAFRIEASNAVEAADMVMNLYTLGEYKFVGEGQDKINTSDGTTTACFTIQRLIDVSAYSGGNSASEDEEAEPTFSGKVIIETKDKKKSYTLYFKKNDEFKIIDGKTKDYTNKDIALQNIENWEDDYSKCS